MQKFQAKQAVLLKAFQQYYQAYCDYLLKLGRTDKDQAVF